MLDKRVVGQDGTLGRSERSLSPSPLTAAPLRRRSPSPSPSLGKAGSGESLRSSGRIVSVRTLDAVRYVRSIPPSVQRVAIKLDVEGSEFELLRDLIVSGALCGAHPNPNPHPHLNLSLT